MRLIDADALIDYFNFDGLQAGDTIAVTDVQAIIAAAPTISCAECEHTEYCYRTLEWNTEYDNKRDRHYPFGCDLFQRRQP